MKISEIIYNERNVLRLLIFITIIFLYLFFNVNLLYFIFILFLFHTIFEIIIYYLSIYEFKPLSNEQLFKKKININIKENYNRYFLFIKFFQILFMMLIIILICSYIDNYLINVLNIAVAYTNTKETLKNLTVKDTITFSEAIIETNGEYISLNVKETNTFLDSPRKPIMPVFTKTYKFPFGTKIKNVDCIITGISEEKISGPIRLAPEPQTLTSYQKTIATSKKVEEEINQQDLGIYPDKWFDYEIKCGLDRGKRTVFVIFQVYPIRYAPSENKILEIKRADLKIDYDKEENVINKENKYDLVIITPKTFYDSVLPLKIHKEKMGISTNITTIEFKLNISL